MTEEEMGNYFLCALQHLSGVGVGKRNLYKFFMPNSILLTAVGALYGFYKSSSDLTPEQLDKAKELAEYMAKKWQEVKDLL